MNTQTTKRPYTLRELGEWASDRNMDILQALDFFAPWPTAPAGYTLPRNSEYRWIGPEIIHGRFILTPVWNAMTDTHSVDVWLADHTRPNYSSLTPAEAADLAAALLQATQAARAVESK